MGISRASANKIYDALIYLSNLARGGVSPEARLFAAMIVNGALDEVYLASKGFTYHCRFLGVDEGLAFKVIQTALGGKHDS